MKKKIKLILIIIPVLLATLIILLDLDCSSGKTSGAGDIWWVSVPEINESYIHFKNP